MRREKHKIKPHNLIFIYLVTTIIVATLSLSKYSSTIVSEGTARVAAFVINAQGRSSNNLSIDCNTDILTANYDIIVTNENNNQISDVSLKYDISVEFSTALPAEMSISLTVGDESKTYNGGQKKYTFENIGEFTAGNKETATHILTITGSKSLKDNFDATMSIDIYSEQVD